MITSSTVLWNLPCSPAQNIAIIMYTPRKQAKPVVQQLYCSKSFLSHNPLSYTIQIYPNYSLLDPFLRDKHWQTIIGSSVVINESGGVHISCCGNDAYDFFHVLRSPLEENFCYFFIFCTIITPPLHIFFITRENGSQWPLNRWCTEK